MFFSLVASHKERTCCRNGVWPRMGLRTEKVYPLETHRGNAASLRFWSIFFGKAKAMGIFHSHVWSLAGWWFGTFFIFPYIGNNHPNWLIFFRGVQTTNQLITMEFFFQVASWVQCFGARSTPWPFVMFSMGSLNAKRALDVEIKRW